MGEKNINNKVSVEKAASAIPNSSPKPFKIYNTYHEKTPDVNENSYYFNGIYRGYVVYNKDPKNKGRLKIFVPGVYPRALEVNTEEYYAKLPWANPAMPTFGGNAAKPDSNPKISLNSKTGWCSVPHPGDICIGAQVFVFFENGNINYPVYFAFAQSDDAWLSEHENQHVFQTDNVTVRIDENPEDSRSSCRFDSYSDNISVSGKKQIEKDAKKKSLNFDQYNGQLKNVETRIDIEIEATKKNAVNLNIHGNVNLHIDGDWFIEHIGNRYEYHEGDTYVHHVGTYELIREGDDIKTIKGDITFGQEGHLKYSQKGNQNIFINGKAQYIFTENIDTLIQGSLNFTVYRNFIETIGLLNLPIGRARWRFRTEV